MMTKKGESMNALTKWILGSLFAVVIVFGGAIWGMTTSAIEEKADKIEVRYLDKGQQEIKAMVMDIQKSIRRIEIDQARRDR